MATRPKAVIESRNGEKFSPITIAKNVLTDDGQNLHDILSDRKEDMMTPTIENSGSMSKVGQGDNVDYSENVVNGAYESCVLKGKSMVNCIQEPSSQDVVLPYEFADGQYVTINDTKESGALGVELKGQTLVNVIDEISFPSNGNHYFYVDLKQYEINKDYLFMIFNAPKEITEVYFGNGASTIVWRGYTSDFVRNGSTISLKVTCPSNYDGSKILPHVRYGGASLSLDVLKQIKVMLIPYQEGMENWDVSYFTGMQSVKMPILHIIGKNLFNPNNVVIDSSNTYGYIDLSKHEALTFSITDKDTSIDMSSIFFGATYQGYNYDGTNQNGGGWLFANGEFARSSLTTTQCKYFSFHPCNKATFDKIIARYNIQIEEGSTVTSYEPHKSSILSLPEEVVLGGLGNTRDTFNTTTGKYTKRTDTMTVTNYKNSLGSSVVEGAWSIVVTPPNKKWQVTTLCVSDKFSMGGGHSNRDCGFYENPANFVFFDKTVNSADEFIAKYGDFSFTYMLEIPVVTKINLPSTLKSWNTTTHIYSEIPENTLYPTLSHSNPTYPVILKPSTKYSIVANSYSNNHTNSAINFNLGGATASTTVGNRVTTITTPSTLSNELLTMGGRGNKLNNVMVIEGDVAGDEPYFEGMCDCKSPILSNVGKNLFNINGAWEKCSYSMGIPCITYANPKIDIVSQKEFTITTDASGYNNGFGQYIDISTLDGITVEATALFSEAKTSLECKILLLQEGEGLPLNVKTGEDKNFTLRTVSTSTSEQRMSINIDTSKFTKMFIMFSGGWKSTMNGSFIFTMKDVYVGGTNQTYEPYKSNTTTFDQKDGKTIVLRSLPNGVCDTLNVETGEYVQRIGEIVLDNSHSSHVWNMNADWSMGDIAVFWSNNVVSMTGNSVLCDKLPSLHRNELILNNVAIKEAIRYGVTSVQFFIRKSRLETPDVAGFKRRLSQNPVTIQYELTTPIVSTVDIQGFPYAYTNGHVQLSSGSIEQSLTPKVEYSVVTNRNGQIRSNQKMVERHQKQLDQLQAMILTNLVNTQYEQTLTNLKYDLKNVREEAK